MVSIGGMVKKTKKNVKAIKKNSKRKGTRISPSQKKIGKHI
jgi:hypothetical protein